MRSSNRYHLFFVYHDEKTAIDQPIAQDSRFHKLI